MEPKDKLDEAFVIAGLLKKRLASTPLTAEEHEQLEKWVAVSDDHQVLLRRVLDENELAFALLDFREVDTERELEAIKAKLARKNNIRWSSWSSMAAAAVILTILSIGIAIFWFVENDQKPVVQTVEHPADLPPGGNRAILTLADGRTINLSDAQSGIVINKEDITYGNGALEVVDLSPETAVRLELSTPKGGTYHLTLPDGSRVWLNAESTLIYPSQFNSEERRVELEGEAFFEISKSETPFRVSSANQTVEVLGTTFTISAYADEPSTKTTLVEGSVQVVYGKSMYTNRLEVGQQSVLIGEKLDVDTADIEKELAWKNGLFFFRNTPFEEMMRQISRWYDVEVIYHDQIPRDTFTGKMSRDLSLMTVLELLNVSNVHIQLKNNQLIVD